MRLYRNLSQGLSKPRCGYLHMENIMTLYSARYIGHRDSTSPSPHVHWNPSYLEVLGINFATCSILTPVETNEDVLDRAHERDVGIEIPLYIPFSICKRSFWPSSSQTQVCDSAPQNSFYQWRPLEWNLFFTIVSGEPVIRKWFFFTLLL